MNEIETKGNILNKEFTEEDLEHYSSAYTLSDMEIFIFPDLMYSLVVANILSPQLWSWRKDPWFSNIEKKSFNYKLNRVKQYIMDHFVFNLDLDTWGLTTKEKEIKRFENFVDMAALKESNALFGYEGDKYYFDIDIRRHFGLDKYQDNIIPYWKTETLEAMSAFRYKEGYSTGAGECVSLAALYVAAMFVVGRIPLEKMFMIATPLHSQNFIMEGDGLMTNNRRIVTKKMWYNGTELSAKARRAVEKEKVTIVSHISGYIHYIYKNASINEQAYKDFKTKFKAYLKTEFTFEVFISFLYSNDNYWKCFQYAHQRNGRTCYISLESIFNAQRSSKNRFDNESRAALMQELEAQAFSLSPIGGEILINEIEDYLYLHPDCGFECYEKYFLEELFTGHCDNVHQMFKDLKDFIHIEARLPKEEGKVFEQTELWNKDVGLEREDYVQYIYEQASQNVYWAQLAIYAYRDMRNVSWQPFLKAAMERNPLGASKYANMQEEEAYRELLNMANVSIYGEDFRLAQPDEVWSFIRGDGLEKAIAMLNILKAKNPQITYQLSMNQEGLVELKPYNATEPIYRFQSQKKLKIYSEPI